MRGRLNLFQAAMLRWRGMYPYNAVHVAQLPGTLDVERLRRAIGEHLAWLGVTRLTLDAAQRQFEFGGGAAPVDLAVIAPGADPLRTIEQAMEEHLNRPFPDRGPFEPFRFFAMPAGATFHVGVAYDHLIAGGDSIVVLLKGIAGRYAGTMPEGLPPPSIYPPTYGKLFRRNPFRFYFGQYSLPSMLFRARRAFRPRYRYGDGPHNAFASLEFPPELYAAVVRSAKAWGVTFNDLLLALLLKALGPEVPERLHERRRREIAIASVINIRHELAPGPDAAFGQFLSSQLVSHPVPEDITLEALARAVHGQTQRVKRRKLYLQTLYMLSWGGLVWPYMTAEQRKQMYAKNYPVWGGMSTLNVDAIWRAGAGTAPVLHYLRAVSTGPFSPLVMAPASIGESLHIGLTYRTAAFSAGDIARIEAALVASARTLV